MDGKDIFAVLVVVSMSVLVSFVAGSTIGRYMPAPALIRRYKQDTACAYLCGVTPVEQILPESNDHGPRCLCSDQRIIPLKVW